MDELTRLRAQTAGMAALWREIAAIFAKGSMAKKPTVQAKLLELETWLINLDVRVRQMEAAIGLAKGPAKPDEPMAHDLSGQSGTRYDGGR